MTPDVKTRLSKDEVEKLAENFEKKEPKEILQWSLDTFHPRIALSSSFSAEDVALIDMLSKINPKFRIFTLDTGRLNQETYSLMDRIRTRYGIQIEVYYPNTASVEKMVREHGMNLFYKSVSHRRLCCKVRKVEPLMRALSGLDAWITGLRREQSVTRTKLKKIEIDEAHRGILKINPLADWSSDQVWDYVKKNNVPYNPLYDQGYTSIGCEPCTRPIKPGEDIRAGRWWWESPEKKECGLHVRI
jgi:phosphoadenosine phosphosulfate reductase